MTGTQREQRRPERPMLTLVRASGRGLTPAGAAMCLLGLVVSDTPLTAQAGPAASEVTRDGIGPVALTMSERDLIDLLGEDAVQRRDYYVGEGVCAPGAVVFPDSEREIEVMWKDTTYSDILQLSVRQENAPWHTASGVHIGTTLKELEQVAGEPVEFWGFEFDYGGAAEWTERDLTIRLRLGPTEESRAGVLQDPRYVEIVGDRLVRSDHPIVRQLTVVVYNIVLGGLVASGEQHNCPGEP